VDFGDNVWNEAVVEVSPGIYESNKLLAFSTFNGVYTQDGIHGGRPIYREARKFDGNGYKDMVVPAELRYSDDLGAWIFTHPSIKQSTDNDEGWLLRSPDTEEYDLLDVSGCKSNVMCVPLINI